MYFHFENQSIHVNREVSLVLEDRKGNANAGVFKASTSGAVFV